MEKENKLYKEDEIDLLELLQNVWSGRKIVIKFVVCFLFIGVFIAIFSPKEYTASITVVPQTSSSKLGGDFGGFAAMAGINLGSGSSEGIPPSLYPRIVKSVPFQKEILQTSLQFSNLDKKVTYQEYYENYEKFNLLSAIKGYTIGLPGKVAGLFKDKENNFIQDEFKDSIYRVSIEDKKLFDKLQKQLVINNNDKEGFVQISFSMPEALPAAQMTKRAQELLQKSITEFKVQKAKEEYEFIEERYKEIKEEFLKKQVVLANFRDRNQGLILSRSQSRLERLQSEYNLVYGIYSELAKQLETQKIKLKENTPIFTVINPVSVPIEKSRPRRTLILVFWIFIGLILGIGFVLAKIFLKDVKLNY